MVRAILILNINLEKCLYFSIVSLYYSQESKEKKRKRKKEKKRKKKKRKKEEKKEKIKYISRILGMTLF